MRPGLLAALRNDGRAPIAALAARLGVSRATITSRIERSISRRASASCPTEARTSALCMRHEPVTSA